MKNTLILTIIALGELMLFVSAFIFPSAIFSAAFLLLLGLLYYGAVKACVFDKIESFSEVVQRNFSLPAILLIIYLLTKDPSLKLAIIAFSAQATMKMMYGYFIQRCASSSAKHSSGNQQAQRQYASSANQIS